MAKKPKPPGAPAPAVKPLPVRGDKYDRAVRLLQDECDDRMILMQNDELDLYLVPSILDEKSSETCPPGTVEYQVSNGPPGERSTSLDIYCLRDAVAEFRKLEEAGGWPAARAGRPIEAAAPRFRVSWPADANRLGTGSLRQDCTAEELTNHRSLESMAKTAETRREMVIRLTGWIARAVPGDELWLFDKVNVVVLSGRHTMIEVMLTETIKMQSESAHWANEGRRQARGRATPPRRG